MQYEPIKNSLDRFFSRSVVLRKILYFLLDLLLLRSWHVRKTLRKVSALYPGEANVLDAGSGLGQYSYRMARKNKQWKITGVDINQDQIDDCNIFFRNINLSNRVSCYKSDLTLLNDTRTYDIVLSVDVMEHIEDDTRVFRNFCKALKNNGILIISTPSDKGGSDVHDDNETSFIDEHVRDGYSPEEITEKLTGAGFGNIETHYTYGRPGSISWRLSMKYPIKMLNVSYLFFIVLPFYYLIAFPVSVILNIFDLCITHKTGTGLLVTARKLE